MPFYAYFSVWRATCFRAFVNTLFLRKHYLVLKDILHFSEVSNFVLR